jgi:hypothetical protein
MNGSLLLAHPYMTGMDDFGASCCLPPVEVIPKSESANVISSKKRQKQGPSEANLTEIGKIDGGIGGSPPKENRQAHWPPPIKVDKKN